MEIVECISLIKSESDSNMLFNRVTKNFPCRRWSPFLALLYLFIVVYILYNLTFKLQHNFNDKNQVLPNKQFENNIDKRISAHISKSNSLRGVDPQIGPTNVQYRELRTEKPIDNENIYAIENEFHKSDENQDGLVTLFELTESINAKILQHIDEAIRLNPREFRFVDILPANGVISWEEYHRLFLKEHGITENDIDEHGHSKNRQASLDMARDKRRWSEAARTDLFGLTIDEYMTFRHPECSVTRLLDLVDDLLRLLDTDGDDMLSLDEFSDVNQMDDVELLQKCHLPAKVEDRHSEFKKLIDHNGDGKADRRELLHYIDPKTKRFALREAANLINLCDENSDKMLDMNEFHNNMEIIMDSKLINVVKSFHNEL